MGITPIFQTIGLVLLIVFGVCRCASTVSLLADSCEGTDYFELGRQHGSQGLRQPSSKSQPERAPRCIPKKEGEIRQRYLIGYRSGLADYCTEENGFNVGSSGQKYFSVCPTLSEREFLKGLQKGVQHRNKQTEVRKLDKRISLLKETLESKTLKTETKNEVTELLSFLEKQRRQKVQDLNQ